MLTLRPVHSPRTYLDTATWKHVFLEYIYGVLCSVGLSSCLSMIMIL
jgi:hypothetical protein